MQRPKPRQMEGGWKEIKVLGTGGFGTVMLFENEESGEKIALKKCRLVQEMLPKHRSRWTMEIQIMLRLDHENVIHAMTVPPPLLAVQEDDLPMLAMEFCSEGDLRNVLNLPENCCGMPEYQVRNLTKDVAAGIEYLHLQRIIHRDLKPENIVLQRVDDKRIVYKLIDLGYAKDMEQGSVCTSFVGTLQYLAPELFRTSSYSATVDYWSFGTLVFECIVGIRPFLHGHQPMQWQEEVSRKGPKQIYAYLNERGTISFDNNLPKPNLLCIPSQSYYEEWLRLMLLWDAKQRGGPLMPSPKRHRCFAILDEILKTKILYILCLDLNRLITYPVQNPKQPLASIQSQIEHDTGIPQAQQEFFFSTGMLAESKQPLELCWPEEPCDSRETCNLFLFRQGSSSMESLVQWKQSQTQLPALVREMIGDQGTLMMYLEQRKVWSHVVYYVRETFKEYDRLLDAEMAAMMYLLRSNANMTKSKAQMSADMAILVAKINMFIHSVQYDLRKYEEQAKTGITSKKMVNRWENQKQTVEEYNRLKKDVEILEQQCTALNARVMEIHKSPYACNNPDREDTELAHIQREVMDQYKSLRQLTHEQRKKGADNRTMVALVLKCRDAQDRLTSNLHAHFSTIVKCKSELRQLNPKIEEMIARIKSAESEVSAAQKQRQKDVWYLVGVALMINNSGTSATTPEAGLDLQMPPLPSPATPGGLPFAPSPAAPSSALPSSTSMMVENAVQYASTLITDSSSSIDRLDGMLGSVMDDSTSDRDWDFLLPPPVHNSASTAQVHHGLPPPPSPHSRPSSATVTRYVNVPDFESKSRSSKSSTAPRQSQEQQHQHQQQFTANPAFRGQGVAMGRGAEAGQHLLLTNPQQQQQQQQQQHHRHPFHTVGAQPTGDRAKEQPITLDATLQHLRLEPQQQSNPVYYNIAPLPNSNVQVKPKT